MGTGMALAPALDGHEFTVTAFGEVQCGLCLGLWVFDEDTGPHTLAGIAPTLCDPQAQMHGEGRECDGLTRACEQFEAHGDCVHLAATKGCNCLSCQPRQVSLPYA